MANRFFSAPFRWRLMYAALAGCLWYPFVYLLDIDLVECFFEFGIDRAVSSLLGIAYAVLIIVPLIGSAARAGVVRVLSICALGFLAIYALWSVVGLYLETPLLWLELPNSTVVQEPADVPAMDLVPEQDAEVDQPPGQVIEEVIVPLQSGSWRSRTDFQDAINTVILCALPLVTGALVLGVAAGLAIGRLLRPVDWTTLVAISFVSGFLGGVLNLIWKGDFLSPLRVLDIALIFAAWLLMLAWTFERSLRAKASS